MKQEFIDDINNFIDLDTTEDDIKINLDKK